MKLRFLGGAREVGRSAVLVNDSLLLDYGSKPAEPTQWPVGSVSPDAVVVSHGHLDHVGGIPALLSGRDRPPVHWTPPTRAFARLLARDTLKLKGGTMQCPFTETDVQRLGEVSVEHGYGESFEAAGHEVTLYNAGHIPGSAHVLVDDGETRLLYTGDFHTDSAARRAATSANGRETPVSGQRLVPASTARPDADVVLCESTYSDVTHEPRTRVEERFAQALRETTVGGGTVVVPAFAIGRTQEVLLVCAAHDIDCYVDGMGVEVLRMLRDSPEFLRDPEALRRAQSNAREVTGRDGQSGSFAPAGHTGRGASRGQRKRIVDQNTVVVTTSGMLTGGPAMTYVPEIAGHPRNLVAFSGYQVEGTPGRDLLETGSAELDGRRMPVSARVEAFDLSAHADRDGLRSFLDSYRDARVLVNHGDRCPAFARELEDEGYDATAPELGATLTV